MALFGSPPKGVCCLYHIPSTKPVDMVNRVAITRLAGYSSIFILIATKPVNVLAQ